MLVDGSVTVHASRDEVKKDLHEFWSEVYYPITNEFSRLPRSFLVILSRDFAIGFESVPCAHEGHSF